MYSVVLAVDSHHVDASHRHYVTVAHGKFHAFIILCDIFVSEDPRKQNEAL